MRTPAIRLRPVERADLPAFFEHQRDPEANRMAVANPRDADPFAAHWEAVFADPEVTARAILADEVLVGQISCFPSEGGQPSRSLAGPGWLFLLGRASAFGEFRVFATTLTWQGFELRAPALPLANPLRRHRTCGRKFAAFGVGHAVGYWIARAHWGRGIASQALALLLGEVAVRPLHARVARSNPASLRVLERGGFRLVRYEDAPGTERFPACVEAVLVLG